MTWTPSSFAQSSKLLLHPEEWRENPLGIGLPIVTRSSGNELHTPGSAHSPIYIHNDSDFASQALAEGWSGNGTAANPYIIEELDIDGTNATYCVVVYGTTVHFSIRHCNLRLNYWAWDGVVVLDNVSNGVLLNNTCADGLAGIVILDSTRITVAHNNCSNNNAGIEISGSTLIKVANNTCVANYYFDILMDYSLQNSIVNNTCSSPYGNLALLASSDNTLVNNTLTGCGLWLWESVPFESRQALVTGNTVNGKPLVFWQDQVGGTVPSGFGQAVLTNCSLTVIRDSVVINCFIGITLCSCNGVTVSNVFCSDNVYGLIMFNCNGTVVTQSLFEHSQSAAISIQNTSFYNAIGNNTCRTNGIGIELWASGNTLWNNTCINNSMGIVVGFASSNTIGGSWIVNNSALGIALTDASSGNNIEANLFFANAIDAVDDSPTGNVFDANYWFGYSGPDKNGDGFGDTTRLIPSSIVGVSHSTDYRPLMLLPGSPVTWLQVPTDQYFASGYYIWYDLDATASPPGIKQWWLIDYAFFSIDQYGVFTNRVPLGPGVYGMQVWVSDWMNNVVSASFNIIVFQGTTTTTTNLTQPSIIPFILVTVAALSAASFASIVGIVLLRQRRTMRPPPTEPFGDTRPPVDQWNARCPLCGSYLFGDEGYCPGCGNRVTRPRDK